MMSRSIPAYRSNVVDAHKARYAMLAARLASLAQIKEHARCTVDAMARNERRSDQPEKPRVLDGSVRDRRAQPSVLAAGRDLQEPAHRPNVALAPVRFNELVDPSDLPSAEPGLHRLPSTPVTQLASRVH